MHRHLLHIMPRSQWFVLELEASAAFPVKPEFHANTHHNTSVSTSPAHINTQSKSNQEAINTNNTHHQHKYTDIGSNTTPHNKTQYKHSRQRQRRTDTHTDIDTQKKSWTQSVSQSDTITHDGTVRLSQSVKHSESSPVPCRPVLFCVVGSRLVQSAVRDREKASWRERETVRTDTD